MSIYACSDLHGNYELYEKINNFIKPEDIVYFLGDAGDRGPDGFKCIKSIYENPRWIYIKGNHELMLQNFRTDYSLWYCNGGESTFEQMMEMCSDEEVSQWIDKIKRLPVKEKIKTLSGKIIYLCHSGLYNTIWHEDILWDREHFYSEEQFDENEYIIHGHTPTVSIRNKLSKISDAIYTGNIDIDSDVFVYNNGHKIDIDCGTYVTNKIALIDVDTLEVIYFKV